MVINETSAAWLTGWQITEFSTKLDNNRTQLLKNLDASKEKLASTANLAPYNFISRNNW